MTLAKSYRPLYRLLFVVCALLLSCQSQPQSQASFKVALLSPGPVSDAGWNASAYEGLLRIREELGAEISQVEVKSPAEFEHGFRDYASRGFHLVFGHGFEFQDAAAAVAPDFPNTIFVTSSGTTVRPNLSPMIFEMVQSTYLMGVMTAMMSKTGKAGCVGGLEIPSVKSGFLALEAGAKSVNPNCVVVQSFIGNWEDVGAAKEATLALLDQGADFIFQNADAAGLGVFQAVQERGTAFAFGSNKNQNEIAPEVVLASAVLNVPQAFVNVAQRVKNKTFHAELLRLGMKDNVVALALNPKLQDKIPAQVLAKIEEVKAGILAGQVELPVGY